MKWRVAVLLLASLLVACGGTPKSTNAPTTVKEPTQAVVQPTSKPSVEPTEPAEEYSLGEVSDLSKLTSYRAHYTYKWEGTKDGTKESGSWDMLEEFVKDPPARRIVWSGAGAGGASGEGSLEFIQIGQQSYMNTGSGWLSMTSSEEDLFGGNSFLSDPMGLISGNQGELVQRGVSVNGVSADHYTFHETATTGLASLGTISKAQGDVWVSPELQIVVKYTAHYEGENLAIGGGENGTLDIGLDLSDVNQAFTIQAPQGVKPAMPEDIPIVDGATDVTAVSGFVSFKTTQSVADVVAFYERVMPGQDWVKGESLGEGMLSFTKEGRTATIMIQTEDDKTSVTIMAGE